jgi:hypothetical protein
MIHDWFDLLKMSQGDDIIIERIRFKNNDMVIEGQFNLPPLSQLSIEDQIFIIAFIRIRGSIKEMENLFGISYPTVKNRLNKIAQQLEFVEVNPPSSRTEILDKLEKGEISVEEAENKLRGKS